MMDTMTNNKTELALVEKVRVLENTVEGLKAKVRVQGDELDREKQRNNKLTYSNKMRRKEIANLHQRLYIHSLERKYLKEDVEVSLVELLAKVRERKAAEKARRNGKA